MELKDFIHYYLGCDGEIRHGEIVKLTTGMLHQALNPASGVHFKPILRPLSDMTEKDVSVFCSLDDTTSLKSFKVDQQLIEIYYIANGESDQSYYHYYFNALSPRQFHYLISKGFNLFDTEWKYCIDKTKTPTT